MFGRKISGMLKVVVALGSLISAVPASAACGTNTSGWDCLYINGNNVTDQGLQGANGAKGAIGTSPLAYSGTYSLSHWIIGTQNCTLTADGYAEVDTVNDIGQFEFAAYSSTGSTGCSAITFGGFPFVFDLASTHAPSPYTAPYVVTSTGNLEIYHASWGTTAICDDSLDHTFQNDGVGGISYSFSQIMAGYFGDCYISGTLYGIDDIEAY